VYVRTDDASETVDETKLFQYRQLTRFASVRDTAQTDYKYQATCDHDVLVSEKNIIAELE